MSGTRVQRESRFGITAMRSAAGKRAISIEENWIGAGLEYIALILRERQRYLLLRAMANGSGERQARRLRAGSERDRDLALAGTIQFDQNHALPGSKGQRSLLHD